MRKLKDDILRLRSQNLSYGAICKILKCNKGIVSYHLGSGQKDKNRIRKIKHRDKHPFIRKIESFNEKYLTSVKPNQIYEWKDLLYMKVYEFITRSNKGEPIMSTTFNVNDVINKFGNDPSCYITGDKIDIYKPRTYQFDHIIPVSRGGDNSLENLGICTRQANLAKSDMTYEELLDFCHKVIEHNKLQKLGSNQHPLD